MQKSAVRGGLIGRQPRGVQRSVMRPFVLPGVDGLQPAGTYDVDTDEESIDDVSFLAWRRVATMIHQLVGGLRAGMGYCGCATIPALQKEARLIKITQAGFRESHVHDVTITKEAPNYRSE